MKNRLVFLLLMSTTSACVFISEPDVGASPEFDLWPDDSESAELGASRGGSDAGLIDTSPMEQNCLEDSDTDCGDADAGIDEPNSDAQVDEQNADPNARA